MQSTKTTGNKYGTQTQNNSFKIWILSDFQRMHYFIPDLVSSSPLVFSSHFSLQLSLPPSSFLVDHPQNLQNPSLGVDIGQDIPPIMAQTLEAIKGGGGSIKVGTIGTINALMSRELQSVKVPSNEVATDTTSKAKVQADEASTSSSNNNNNNNNNTISEKHTIVDPKSKHHHARKDSRNPFLRSDSASTDGNGTSNKRKNEKKTSCMVDIVDVKCGVPDKTWANPITNRLKKLTFSKLSEAHGVK
ncbi:hypothetical protein SSX86_024414 [Deinandra increscens subsp. villosa]|uniref:Uncharacterized protein n=1 Tax=Deinandra increscens subsp. villosa TaxID=3103831 RepID=A0AAP0CLA9_9ASTR